MTATATRPTTDATASSREELAERVLALLTDQPQSAAALARHLNLPDGSGTGRENPVRPILGTLETRRLAHRIHGRGWTLPPKSQRAAKATPTIEPFQFPYQFQIEALDSMFTDPDYQRPLSGLATRIATNFNPTLFGTLVLSDRGKANKPARYAIVDGQTRWAGARRAGVHQVPVIVFSGLTREDEARMFALLQKERQAMTSWQRFRAALVAKDPEALAVKDVVESAGYKVGGDKHKGEITALTTLEVCYRSNADLLEQALFVLKAAFPEWTPEASYIRGLHLWLKNTGHRYLKAKQQVDHERLVQRLSVAGPSGLFKRATAARDMGSGKSWASCMAMAIDATYKR